MTNQTILAGGENGLFYRANVRSNWTQVLRYAATAKAVAIMRDGTLLMILSNRVGASFLLGDNGQPIDEAGIEMIGVAVKPDDTLVGVGRDQRLYSKATLKSPWVLIPNAGPATAVTVMPNGAIVFVGLDRGLWMPDPQGTGTWVSVPNSGIVKSVAAMSDGSLLGVGTGNELFSRATLSSPWVYIPKSEGVSTVAVAPPGITFEVILGVDSQNKLCVRQSLMSPWKQIPNTGDILSAIVMRDSTVLAAATNMDLCTHANVKSAWVGYANSGPVISLASRRDGTVLAVNAYHQICVRTPDNTSWSLLPTPRPLIALTVMPDGRMVGVGTDNRLWADDGNTWCCFNDGGLLKGVAALSDGTLLGIGMYNDLWTLADLQGRWVNIPNSGSVKAIAVAPYFTHLAEWLPYNQGLPRVCGIRVHNDGGFVMQFRVNWYGGNSVTTGKYGAGCDNTILRGSTAGQTINSSGVFPAENTQMWPSAYVVAGAQGHEASENVVYDPSSAYTAVYTCTGGCWNPRFKFTDLSTDRVGSGPNDAPPQKLTVEPKDAFTILGGASHV